MADSNDEVTRTEGASGSEQGTPDSGTNNVEGSGTEASGSEASGAEDTVATSQVNVKYDNVIPSSYFRTPGMEDFYLGAVDCSFLNRMDKMVNGEENPDHEKAAFYTESPKKDVGLNTGNEAFTCSGADISQESIDRGINNGNTMRVSLDSLKGPNAEEIKNSLKEKIGNDDCPNINVRLVGISAPQPPVWAYEKNVPASKFNKCVKPYGEVKDSDQYVIASGGHHDDSANITFVSIGGKWHEMDAMEGSTVYMNFRWCLSAGDKEGNNFNEDKEETRYDAGDMKAANNLKRLIEGSEEGEVYLDIDKTPNGFKSRFEDISSNEEAMALLKDWHEAGKGTDDGYTIVTEDKYANFMATAYVKYSNRWVNLAKAALTDDSNKTIAPDTSYDGKLKNEFKPLRYDKKNITYADAYYDPADLDDRGEIQQQATGMDWTSLHDWTVTLGDVTLFVPPSNISIVTETEKQEMPLLRANGAMHKVGKRIKRSMSVNLFFNEDKGINGYKIKDKTPSGQELTYSVNGLRALISQFKFIPFIPVENSYINNVLHIQAVVIENFVISSVPGFPRLIKGTILMTEFNYGVYMPEAINSGIANEAPEVNENTPGTETEDGTTAEINAVTAGKEDGNAAETEGEEEEENEYGNFFSDSFNWKTARWYYQRALIKGDNMKGLKFNSDLYNVRMLQNRTALIPMSFKNPNVTFYIANAEYLEEMMQARMERRKRAMQFDKYEREGLNKFGAIYDGITEAQNDPDFQAEIDYLKSNFDYYNENAGNLVTRMGNGSIYGTAMSYAGCTMHTGLTKKSILDAINVNDIAGTDEADATIHINKALSILKSHIEKVNETVGEEILSSPRFESYNSENEEEGRVSWGISFKVDIHAIEDDDKQENVRKNIATNLGLSKDSVYKDGRIYIPIYATYKPELLRKAGDIKEIGLDTDYSDVKFLEECKNQAGGTNNANKKTAQVNSKQLENLYYDKYVTARVENWSASLTNHISRMNVCDLSGASPQYLGGDDITISLDIVTTDVNVVDKLNGMPTVCAVFGRRYRAVMPSSVVKAQAEFMQFLGVSEVLINDVQIDTVPGQPGVWRIHIDITSDDRTLRTREALDKIEGINAGVVGGNESFLDVMSPGYKKGTSDGKDNPHAPAEDDLISRTVKTYFDLSKTIAKAELYPDLELPTLEEMENIGWDFIRYKFQDDRVYVDPDFYFVYPNNLSSQMIREFILANPEGEEAQIKYRDNKGGEMTVEPATRMGFNIISRNEVAQAQKDLDIQLSYIQNKAKTKQLKENLKDESNSSAIADANTINGLESWEVCDDIKASYMEEKYKKEYDSYVARIRAESVTNNYQNEQNPQTQGQQQAQGQGQQTENQSQQEQSQSDSQQQGEQSQQGDNANTNENTNAENGNGQDSGTDSNNTESDANGAGNTDNTGNANAKADPPEPEGKWVNSKLADARHASELIEQYLCNTPISDPIPEKPTVAIEREASGAGQESQNESDEKTSQENQGTQEGQDPSNGGNTGDESGENTNGNNENNGNNGNNGNSTQETDNNQSELQGDKTSKNNDSLIRKSVRAYNNSLMESKIHKGVRQFFNDPTVIEIFSCINADVTNADFIDAAVDIVYSAACAATGEKEYSDKQKSTGWRPDPNFFGYKIGSSQDTANREQAHNTEEAIECATEFGCFGIKQYEANEFQQITGEKAIDVWGGGNKLNETRYLIDPYYRSLAVDDIKQYKKGCINDPTYCTTAYLRLCLYWLKKLIDCQAYPSINLDVLRHSTEVELSILKQTKENGALSVGDAQMLEHILFFKKRAYALDAGKLWSAAVLASGEGNPTVMQRIQSRDYRALNGYISGLSRPRKAVPVNDKQSLTTRKMMLALIGVGRIDSAKALGVPQEKEATPYMGDMSEKKYLENAEDPSIYCVDACHDMIVHDARGRMLRAFPTYYMLFIDEGREVGMWKLHDNFYSSMSIASIEVVKSRKIPADTAHIIMSNFYKSFMTEGDDYTQTDKITSASWDDTFASVFGPIPGINKVVGLLTGQDLDTTTYGQRLEAERKNKPPEDRIRLRPGARIHIRMGYGSNAAELPVVFNGSIAEVSSQEAVEIVAQGDGIELMNPIMDDDNDVVDTVHDDEFFCLPSNGETPKNIVNAYLTNIGGKMARTLKAAGAQHLLGRSPYGIYHFGNPDYKELFSMGEPTQNIFEACAKPAWGSDNSITALSGLDNAPKITFDPFQKTVWDVVNVCRSITPDHICGVAPFDYRSTLFMGHPRFYYAYTYTNNNGMGVQERRKPYQQFHIYDSSSDIIGNGIIATKSKMKTVALGLYTIVESLYIKNQEKVGPLYADIDIYPENQKTMIVDTQLLGKGTSYLGGISNSFTQRFDSLFDEKGAVVSFEKIAWRMTASALKDSVKEMYAGDLVVMGDPTVKPHDRISIIDTYQGISGQATVKEVVHSMSVDRGFITTISPDCINTVDDRFENVVQPWFAYKSALAHAVIGMLAMNVALIWVGKEAGERWISSKTIAKGVKKVIKKINPLAQVGKLARRTGIGRKVILKARRLQRAVGRKIMQRAMTTQIGAWVAAHLIAGPAGWAALTAEVLGLIACTAFGAFVNAFLEMTMKNLQVLQIYPLRRYGLCWTAGVEGSKGLVVGSPSHNQQGALTQAMINLFGSDSSGVLGVIGAMFGSDGLEEIADKYSEQMNVVDESGNGTDIGYNYGEVITRQSVRNGDIPNDYRSMQISPRVVYNKNSDEFQQTREHFAIMNKENWMSDSRLQHMKLVSQDTRLKPYMEEQPSFFRIVHEEPALNKDGGQVDSIALSKNGARYYVKAMHQPLSNGGECLDVPMLHKEAIHVLYEIIRRTKNNMLAANSSDQNEAYEQTKGSFVILESALRIGDGESMGATGFTFILEATDKAIAPMSSAITEFSQEIADDAAENNLCNKQIFTCKALSKNRVAINVLMPKLANDKVESAEETAKKEAEEQEQENREGDAV